MQFNHTSAVFPTASKEFQNASSPIDYLNEKTHHIYSDKFSLHMLDLTCIHLATPHDKACHLDDWARLFKATTWEEIKMIAKNNTDLTESSETLYTLNADYMVRKQCEARADYYRLHNTINKKLNTLTAEVESLTSENQNLTSKVQNLTHDIHEKDILIRQLKAQLHQELPPV